MKVDLHVHTCYSKDSLMSLETIIETCRRRGIDKVAITDHNTIAGALELKKSAPFPVIVGEEIETTQGEITGLFLSEEIPRGLSLEETIVRIREQGGLVYVPHPLDRVRRSAIGEANLKAISDRVDIVEVFNSRVLLLQDNHRARWFAEGGGLLSAAGSDAHTAYEIGRAYVEMEEFVGEEEFLSSLARGRVVGRLSCPLIHLPTTLTRLYRKMT